MPKILIIEDDELTSSLLSTVLVSNGYTTACALTGEQALQQLNKTGFDIILLDLNLPDEDGLSLIRQIRIRFFTPVFIITSRKGKEDRLAGLDMGADDFITKPFDTDELLLRIRNTLKRTLVTGNPNDDELYFDGWVVDKSTRELRAPNKKVVPATAGEFNILLALIKAAGRVLTREQLLDAVSQNNEGPSIRMVDVFISRLRKKIEPLPRQPRYIITKTGYGYFFDKRWLSSI